MLNILPWRKNHLMRFKMNFLVIAGAICILITAYFLFIHYYHSVNTKEIFESAKQINQEIKEKTLEKQKTFFRYQAEIKRRDAQIARNQQLELLLLLKSFSKELPENGYLNLLKYDHGKLMVEGILLSTNTLLLENFTKKLLEKNNIAIRKQREESIGGRKTSFNLTLHFLEKQQ